MFKWLFDGLPRLQTRQIDNACRKNEEEGPPNEEFDKWLSTHLGFIFDWFINLSTIEK